MSQTGFAPTAEHLVSEADHVQLSRLVTEHAWRVDNGRADAVHELYVDDGELVVPPAPLRGRPRYTNGVGNSFKLPRGASFAMCAATSAS